MFQDWDSFFLLIGTAAGALIGLLFVVETLTVGFERDSALRGARVYITPIVFHFAAVLAMSAIALAPRLTPTATALLLGACALVGLIYSTAVTLALATDRSLNVPHWSDLWFYGVAPAAGYLIVGGGVLLARAAAGSAPYVVGATLTAQLLLGVRNAWDLVTWMAPGATRQGPRD